MLQNFRTIDLVWDLANKNFHQAIELSSSDEQGRRIVVQVLDNGQVVDLTGVGLNLYWETKDKRYMGLDNFTALDVRKGLFELYATTELLSNVGALKGHLYLVTAEGEAITSLSLEINVNQGINTEAVESHNSFSALTDALSRVVSIETDEVLRKEAESLRVQSEQAREQAEGLRESRYVEAESERDDLYQTAEQDRYTLYQSTEQERESNFESRASQLEATYAPRLTEAESNISNLTSLVGEGGIVESGSNEHGNFVKFTNGIAIVYGEVSFGESGVQAGAGDKFFYSAADQEIQYPVPFIAPPATRVSLIESQLANRGGMAVIRSNTSTRVLVRVLSFINVDLPTVYQYTAIGRWK